MVSVYNIPHSDRLHIIQVDNILVISINDTILNHNKEQLLTFITF